VLGLARRAVAEAAGAGTAAGIHSPRGWRRLVTPLALFLEAGVLLVAGFLLAFWYAPTDASSMGFSQKIFYFHAPVSEAALLAYAVAFGAAVLYLRRQDPRYDRLGVAAVRLGLLFSVLVMATGMIWGKAAWGTWWTWEPRLTTFLIAFLLYGAYFVLRWSTDEQARRATYCAVFAIVAFVDVPITFFATRYLPEGLHPAVLTTSGTGMAASMFLPFVINLAGMTILLAAMLRLELVHAALRAELDELKQLAERAAAAGRGAAARPASSPTEREPR
jgi:heme exporter protein C